MYLGPPIDDPAILESLPPELADLLRRANGYVAYDGGLHVRGACHMPEWHSLGPYVFARESYDASIAAVTAHAS